MKNYIVKALKGFDDYEGLDIMPENPHIWREKNAIFNCTKERYLYLKDHNAVAFMGIDKIKEEKGGETKVAEVKEEKKEVDTKQIAKSIINATKVIKTASKLKKTTKNDKK